jgi:hypothetical protein
MPRRAQLVNKLIPCLKVFCTFFGGGNIAYTDAIRNSCVHESTKGRLQS